MFFLGQIPLKMPVINTAYNELNSDQSFFIIIQAQLYCIRNKQTINQINFIDEMVKATTDIVTK